MSFCLSTFFFDKSINFLISIQIFPFWYFSHLEIIKFLDSFSQNGWYEWLIDRWFLASSETSRPLTDPCIVSTISTSLISMARITFSRVPAPFSLQSHISTCAASAVSRILMLQDLAERRGSVSSLGLTFAQRNSVSRVSPLSAFHPLLTNVSSFSLLFALPRNFLPTSRNDWLDFVCTNTFLIAGFARGLSRCTSADGPFCGCSAYLARLTVLCAPRRLKTCFNFEFEFILFYLFFF